MTLMRMYLRPLPTILLAFIAFLPLACEEDPDSEGAIQESISTLFADLQFATASNDIESLEQIIKSANRIRPSLQSQKQSKNLLLATAREKLANLLFHQLSVQSLAITTSFTLAENQAYQVALLRSAADSIANASKQSMQSVTSDITASQDAKRDHFDNQLEAATEEVASLDSESTSSREEQYYLREEAELLLNDAEDAGIIDGHKTYKSGIRKLRHSQSIGLNAASIELQSQLQAIPMRDDARVELEAIASILNGMAQTDRLLEELQNSSVQTSSDFRELASQLDAQTAETMNNALTLGTELTQQWVELSTLVQDAIKSSTRGGSRDAQKTLNIWKLELEWTLGRVEEAKRSLLIEEERAVNALVEYGIVTSSDKWREISNSLVNEIEQATVSAIAAYENAKLLTSNTGSQANAIINQLETRRALLSGEEVQLEQTASDAGSSGSTDNAAVRSSGFATPQELVAAFNNAIDLSKLDGTSPALQTGPCIEAKTPEAKQFVALMDGLMNSIGNLLIAIRTNLGEENVQEFLAKNPIPTNGMSASIDPSSIVSIEDNNAQAREVSGKQILLENTANGWKIILGGNSDPESAMVFSMMAPLFTTLADTMKTVTEQVNNGELKSLDAINTAIEQAAENALPF